jgi:FkbM family methyltransferase
MVTLKGLVATVRTTRSFWDALFLKVSNSRRNIAFRNGIQMDLNWEEYCRVREVLERARALNYIVCQLDDDLYSVESERIKMIGPLSSLSVYFCECVGGTYECDCSNKVVLDVGGFCGETAVFFSSLGAKRVIIYEPVVAHHDFIRRNMTLNVIEAELHEEGIGDEEGIRTIHYESADTGFGILSKGENELKIRVRNVADVIEESRADIGKFDCEGAEKSLISVPRGILRKIDFYIIETHGPEIREAIMDKFNNAGFRLLRSYGDAAGAFSLLHFKKTPELSDIAEPSVAVSPDYVMSVH